MDPDGEFGFVGAIIGAVSEGLMEAGSQLADGGITDLGAIGEAALEGAILAAVVPGAAAGSIGRLLKTAKNLKTKLKAGSVPKSGAVNNATKVKLNKQLASQEQVGELNSGVAERIAGAGTNKPLRDAPRLANEYGGEAGDWAKIGSSNRKHLDGFSQETHAYQNVKTGQIVEHKSKIAEH